MNTNTITSMISIISGAAHKIVIVSIVSLLFTNSAFSSDSTTPQYQKDIDEARNQANKQLQDTYAKNKQQALAEAKKEKEAAATPPPAPRQPLWEQAVNPKNIPAVAPNINVPATTDSKAPGTSANPSPQLPVNPFQLTPPPAAPQAQQASPPPQASSSGETPPPTNIYQVPADPNAPAIPNLYK